MEGLEREAGEALRAQEKELAAAQQKLAAQVNSKFAQLEKQLDGKVGAGPDAGVPACGFLCARRKQLPLCAPTKAPIFRTSRKSPLSGLRQPAQPSIAAPPLPPSLTRCGRLTQPPWPSSSSSTRCGRSTACCTTEWRQLLRCGAEGRAVQPHCCPFCWFLVQGAALGRQDVLRAPWLLCMSL